MGGTQKVHWRAVRVLIADAFEQSGRNGLAAIGCEVVYEPGLKDDFLIEGIRRCQPHVLVVRSAKVTEPMLDAGPLKLVVRAGAGYNTIDVAAASRRGIYVSNCPGKNSIAVAELAFGLILALDRRIADNTIALRRKEWNKAEFSKARGVYGRILGLIGVGQIGREMIPRARAFGMDVIGWSRSLTPDRARELGIQYRKSPIEVAGDADFVSVHLALAADTRGMLGDTFFGAMREGTCFINTSRGEVVDQTALVRAMRERGIRAGLDVFAKEPAGGKGEFTDPIAEETNLYGTHHIGASTDQAQEAIAAETVRVVQVFQETGKVPNVVNLAKSTPATHVLVVRHQDRPGVLAQVLESISAAGINVQEMENIIFDGAEAAVASIHLETPPPPETLETLRKVNSHILEVNLLQIR